MFSLAYMTIFLKHISNVALMREFLCYLMRGRYDDRPVLNSLMQHISSANHLVINPPPLIITNALFDAAEIGCRCAR